MKSLRRSSFQQDDRIYSQYILSHCIEFLVSEYTEPVSESKKEVAVDDRFSCVKGEMVLSSSSAVSLSPLTF